MKKLSSVILADLVASKRKEKSMTQQALAEATGINRALISRIEKQDFIPSIPQLEQLGEVLGFEPDSVFADTAHDRLPSPSPLRIAVAGTGYVGLSIATLLAQHNHVTAVDILPEKVDLINRRKSPIQDDYIEKYLAEKELDLTATLDGAAAYKDADYVIIAAPTNYDSARNYFDTSAVEAVIELVLSVNRYAKNTTPQTSSSVRNFSASRRLCMTISTRAGSSSRPTPTMRGFLPPREILPHCCRRAPSRKISRRFSWDLPRRKPSNFLQTPIWRCACPISMSLTPMRRRKI